MCNISATDNGTETSQTVYAMVYGSVTAVGLPLNVVSLCILLRFHSLKSPSAVFMVNLAISDLILVISLPLRVYYHATGLWPLGSMACIWITMLFHNNIRSSSIFITFICVDRLLAVVYPLKSRHLRTSSCAWKAAGLVWLFVLVVNVPESWVFSQNLNMCNITSCFDSHLYQSLHKWRMEYLQAALVSLMLAVNIVCTAMVSWTLHRHLNDSARINNRVNVMLIFVMNLVMFIVFFLPVSLAGLLQQWISVYTPLLCLASINCCFDPLLYYFSFDGFWKRKEDMDNGVTCERIVADYNRREQTALQTF